MSYFLGGNVRKFRASVKHFLRRKYGA
jgi:hypothetical protein